MFWLIFALISALAFGSQATFTYYFTTIKKLNATSLNTIYHILITILSIIILSIGYFINPVYISSIFIGLQKVFSSQLGLIVLTGLFGAMGNVLLFNSYAAGPKINPGVMTALGNGAIIISVLLPVILYHQQLTLRQIIGIVILLFSFAMLGNDKFKGFGELFGWKKPEQKPEQETD